MRKEKETTIQPPFLCFSHLPTLHQRLMFWVDDMIEIVEADSNPNGKTHDLMSF